MGENKISPGVNSSLIINSINQHIYNFCFISLLLSHDNYSSMRKTYPFLILALIYTVHSFAQTDYLIPFRDGNKWGYCDTLGRMVIPTKFDEAVRFFYGYAHVRIGKENAIIDKTGKIKLKGDFSIDNPYDGFASITTKNKVGLANIDNGKILLAPIYSSLGRNGDLAVLKDSNDRQGLYHISRRKWLLPLKYEAIDIIDSVLTVTDKQKKVYYTITKTGSLINKGLQKNPSELHDSMKEVLADTSAEIVTYEALVPVNVFSPPYKSLFTRDGKVGYYYEIIQDNKIIKTDTISAIYDSVGWVGYNASLLLAKKDGKMGMIALDGTIKIPFLYDEILATEKSGIDSIYLVKQNGQWGLVQFGKVLLLCKYDKIERYSLNSDGLYLMQNNKQGFYVYSDEKKVYNVLIPCKYVFFEPQLYWISLPDTNTGIQYDTAPKNPFFLLGVVTPPWKRGFIDLKGNEFFRD